jgi:molecular chaperone GrpE
MSKKPTVAELEAKIAQLTEALLRERADAINVRRRAEEDKIKMASFYKAKVIRDLLPALDNLERALKHVPKELADHDYVKGVKNVANHFEKNLESLGVEKIKTVGEEFDPNLHEAIHVEDGDGEVEVVCEELQPGYRIGDEIIRHAVVKVKMEKPR